MAVDRQRIGPVGLDRDDAEAVLFYQAPGDRGARAIELRRTVARLAEQHDAAVGEAVECIDEPLVLRLRQPARGLPDQLR